MSTIEDKILDGPRVHYCEADNDDVRQDDQYSDRDLDETGANVQMNDASSLFTRPNDEDYERSSQYDSARLRGRGSTNTGPKGVIEDYREQLLSKKKSSRNDSVDDLEAEFQALLNDDSVLKEYISKRMSEAKNAGTPLFGQVFKLQTGGELLDAIDKENTNVLVIVHIYTRYSRPCANLNRCLNELAKDLQHIKFVTLDAGVTNLSSNFKENGVPALLAYKGGNLVKSLVQLDELLDRDFEAEQVKQLLKDNGVID